MTDTSGNLVANSTIELDPFGGETSQTSNSRQSHVFTSYERDAIGGMDEAGARKYHGWWSRFDQPDPYDGSYNLGDPQSFNRYAYVRNDPVNFTDPSGLDEDVIRIYTWAPRWVPDFNILGFYNQYRTRYVIEDRFSERGARDPKPPTSEPQRQQQPQKTPCDVQVPTDANSRAAVGTILGEATANGYIGSNQYVNGDAVGSPSGEVISAASLLGEAEMMASVLVNRANRDGSSLQDVASASGQFLGYKSGMDTLNSGNFGANGSAACERLRTAVRAVGDVNRRGAISDSLFNWRGVVQGKRKHRFIRNQGNALRFGNTDFF